MITMKFILIKIVEKFKDMLFRLGNTRKFLSKLTSLDKDRGSSTRDILESVIYKEISIV